MGNAGAKKTNRMLEEERGRAHERGQRYRGYGEEERQIGNQIRSDVLGKYGDIYSDISSGGYGFGGGGGYTPSYTDPRFNEAMGGYRAFAETGGFSPEQESEFRSRATSTLPSFYEGLRTDLESGRRVQGSSVGFGRQMSKLAREQGRGAAAVGLEAETDLAEMVRRNKLLGLEGVSRLDTEYMNRLQEVERLREQAKSARSSRARASAQDQLRAQMGILGELRQLRQEQGTDLPYWELEGRTAGQGIGTVESRREEIPWWQTALQTAVPAAASFFAPGIGGGVPKVPKVPKTSAPSGLGYSGF